MQEPVPQEAYSEAWAKSNPFWIFGFDEKAKRRTEGVAPFLLMDTFNLWHSSILDAGCGFGFLAHFLAEYGAKVIGLDYSEYFLSKKVHPDVIKGDMTSMPFENDSFDMVISRENMEHLTIEQAEAAFGEMIRVSKKWLYLTIWINKDVNASDEIAIKEESDDPTHISFGTRKFWDKKFQPYIDSGVLKRDIEKEKILDWKGKGRVWVFEKVKND